MKIILLTFLVIAPLPVLGQQGTVLPQGVPVGSPAAAGAAAFGFSPVADEMAGALLRFFKSPEAAAMGYPAIVSGMNEGGDSQAVRLAAFTQALNESGRAGEVVGKEPSELASLIAENVPRASKIVWIKAQQLIEDGSAEEIASYQQAFGFMLAPHDVQALEKAAEGRAGTVRKAAAGVVERAEGEAQALAQNSRPFEPVGAAVARVMAEALEDTTSKVAAERLVRRLEAETWDHYEDEEVKRLAIGGLASQLKKDMVLQSKDLVASIVSIVGRSKSVPILEAALAAFAKVFAHGGEEGRRKAAEGIGTLMPASDDEALRRSALAVLDERSPEETEVKVKRAIRRARLRIQESLDAPVLTNAAAAAASRLVQALEDSTSEDEVKMLKRVVPVAERHPEEAAHRILLNGLVGELSDSDDSALTTAILATVQELVTKSLFMDKLRDAAVRSLEALAQVSGFSYKSEAAKAARELTPA